MKTEKTYWYDLKPTDNNKGFIYGINYIDNDEIIECKWFKTKQERNKKIESEDQIYIETLNGPEIRDNGKNYK